MNPTETENHNQENNFNSHSFSEANNHNSTVKPIANEMNSLDKVRDILFGNQVRDFDHRFTRLEEKLAKECASLRDETRSRLDSLENYLKQEVESLTTQIKNEYSDRDRSVQLLREEAKTLKSGLDDKISQVEEFANRSQRELREQLFNQSKTLQDTIQQKYEEIIALLERESKDLRHQKTDRSTLAALLNELAIRLNSQS